jgi:hypothetical protein
LRSCGQTRQQKGLQGALQTGILYKESLEVMNLRKHLAGFALFSVIVGCTILINSFLSVPAIKVRSVLIKEAVPQAPFEASQPINFKVRQVSLDRMSNKSYTELRLERQPGQPLPEELWVTTIFFTPEHPGIAAMSKVKIRQPFAQSDQSDFVAAASDSSFAVQKMPASEYYARVYVSPNSSDNSTFTDENFVRDITHAMPVVIQWPDIARQPSISSLKKLTR